MDRDHRKKFLKSLAQAKNQPAQKLEIRSFPGFRPQLFSARPDIIQDIDHIVNIVQRFIISLSGGRVDFTIVWKNPSISGSEYSNSIKNLVNIAKWLYSVMIFNGQAYSIDGLKKIATDLIGIVRGSSFPEPAAASLPNDLISVAQNILTKLS